MFKLADQTDLKLTEINLDGNGVVIPEGISVAAALLYLGQVKIRNSLVNDNPRAPFCMIGQCFECLVTIDGKSNQRACQVIVKKGMCIERQMEDTNLT